jgi:hypothetical protein
LPDVLCVCTQLHKISIAHNLDLDRSSALPTAAVFRLLVKNVHTTRSTFSSLNEDLRFNGMLPSEIWGYVGFRSDAL